MVGFMPDHCYFYNDLQRISITFLIHVSFDSSLIKLIDLSLSFFGALNRNVVLKLLTLF